MHGAEPRRLEILDEPEAVHCLLDRVLGQRLETLRVAQVPTVEERQRVEPKEQAGSWGAVQRVGGEEADLRSAILLPAVDGDNLGAGPVV